jgi:endonuclease VIII
VPEGDTVWLTARRLDQALRERELSVGELRVPQLATTDLAGDTVAAVLARGKHLLIRLGSGLTLHSHLRMDGSWFLTRAGERPRRHPAHMIRARLGNCEWLATGNRVHDLRVVRTSEEDELVGHLGPDLLGADWDVERAVANLLRMPDVPIGESLLDQRNLAGIGNLYKCEALFVERVDPWTPTGSVADLHRLVTSAQRLLRANRDHPAQTTTGRTARGEEHWVYARAGDACRRCGTPIRYAEQGALPYARSTWWCPRCQLSHQRR